METLGKRQAVAFARAEAPIGREAGRARPSVERAGRAAARVERAVTHGMSHLSIHL